jgi:hypothetical protein
MKDNKHIQTFEQHQENLNISDVSGSLLVPLKTLQNWINNLDSLEWTLNHQIGVKEEMEEFLKNYKSNENISIKK